MSIESLIVGDQIPLALSDNARHLNWTVIVVTAPDQESVYAFYIVLRQRQRYGLIDKSTVILTVNDPQDKLGSGGATLNALLVATEFLSAKTGYSLINTNVLHSAHILILHTGRIFPYDACHRSLATLPVRFGPNHPWLLTNLDLLLHDFNNLIASSHLPYGVWVSSTDAFFLSLTFQGIQIPFDSDIHALATLEDVQYATEHGVYIVDKETNNVRNILYRASIQELNKYSNDNQKVPTICSIVYFSVNLAEKLINFHTTPPLDGCTYEGIDSGSQPNQLSLYFDFLLAACIDVTFNQYLSSHHQNQRNDLTIQSKTFLWNHLNGKTKFTCGILPHSCHFQYIDSRWPYLNDNNIHSQRDDIQWLPIQHSIIDKTQIKSQNLSIINSIMNDECHLGKNVTIHNSIVGNHVTLGDNCCIKSVDFSKEDLHLTLPCDVIIQRIILLLQKTNETSNNRLDVYTIIGIHDNVDCLFTNDNFTILNMSWDKFKEQTGIDVWDLWPDLQNDSERRTLANAHLYPVLHLDSMSSLNEDLLWFFNPTNQLRQRWKYSWRLSLNDILTRADHYKEIVFRENLFHKIAQQKILNLIFLHGSKQRTNDSYLALLKQTIIDEHSKDMLDTFDRACLTNYNKLQILSCLFSAIANTLAEMAGGDRAGLRSGPYLNREWKYALLMFEEGKYVLGIQHLIKQRQLWIDRPDLLIRAARHYDGATQTLIKQGVLTCRSKCSVNDSDILSLSQPKYRQVTVECPVRLDLSGGWTDTPPICYEHGGNVLNVAITINGQRPIGARASLVESTSTPSVTFILKGEHKKDDKIYDLHSLTQFSDYNQPQCPCALLKTCCIFTRIIDIDTMQAVTLVEQLKKKLFGYSLILEVWSNVPVGSGLGTSSILAGAILLALWNLIGIANVTDSMIIYGVLVVEQMMTTGGGWQDQIGGLLPAFKLGTSYAQLPLEVDWRQLNVKDDNNAIFWDSFDERLILVYTGQTRLARNLLQSVLRNWYSGAISQLFDELEENAIQAAEAVEQGNLLKLGECMSIYWQQKLRVAPGSEPETCRRLIDLLTPYIYGVTLAGAGGGGFLAALAKTPEDAQTCRNLISQENIPNVSLFSAQIDRHGPVVSFS
ncbi:unnamed protein product [Rotaria magnacalcarata]|uniref:L-fucose kinase n=2 Tax=Rotaria magnacalcarata TaxID=392030 RepID=A0A815LSJ7_9BILA|nr:unnamed protein product [Rotaria magnacalcarata]CAF1407078.1 unnamed protein product [Rotaria magnacalcarata]CAF2084889.1 unnamed protein product [Rotaria magnacalcarata]CAF3802818.1 unnamed protein product [Rotaria magnacalcarata]CAF3811325.1 unnamed protein product [Rotaria magnacalcarata]